MTWKARRFSARGLVAQRRGYSSRATCGNDEKRTALPVSATFTARDSSVSSS